MDRKTIWYIHEYNQLPGSNWRKSRSTAICEILSKEYNVIWWTASFDHHSKTQRPVGEIKISDSFKIEVIRTTGYKKNISIRRFIRDNQFTHNLKKEIKKFPAPDLIITDGNPIRFCEPENGYVMQHKTPVIVDMNDIWPDIIEMMAPRVIKPLAHIALLPIYIKRNKFYKKADAFISTGKHHLEELMRMPGDDRKRLNACVYNGIDVTYFRSLLNKQLSEDISIRAKKEGDIWCVFSGTLGSNYDVELIIQAAKHFETNNNRIRFFVTGNGPQRDSIEKAYRELRNLDYLGVVSYENLVALYGKCDIGLAPYKASDSIDMPDKLFDYFAAGLAVICSLGRDAGDYVIKQDTGLKYEAGNPSDFIKCIQALAENQNILEKKKSNSYEIGGKFDVKEQMAQLSDIVKRILQ